MREHQNGRYRIPQPHIYNDGYGHRMIDGETWFGGIRVPMLPARTALRDLDTGEYRVLSHTNGPLTIALVPIQAYWSDVNRTEERSIGNAKLQLKSGVLSFVYNSADVWTGDILTRRGYDRTVLRLTPGSNGSIVYTPVTI